MKSPVLLSGALALVLAGVLPALAQETETPAPTVDEPENPTPPVTEVPDLSEILTPPDTSTEAGTIPEPGASDEVSGTFVVAADGAGDVGVLGRISIESVQLVGGSLTFVGGGDGDGDDSATPAAVFQTLRCDVGGGSVDVDAEGGGTAQIQLLCDDATPTVTWELSVLSRADDGSVLTLRAVQLERTPFPAADVIDLLLARDG